VNLRGRHWVALWLAGFLVTAVLVVWRQSRALALARQLRTLQTTEAALEASRASTLAGIRRARSRAVLVPLAESRLGLRVAQDSDIIILQDPGAR